MANVLYFGSSDITTVFCTRVTMLWCNVNSIPTFPYSTFSTVYCNHSYIACMDVEWLAMGKIELLRFDCEFGDGIYGLLCACFA